MVNIGIIGTGYWGVNYVRVFSEVPDSKVVLVCDAKQERLRHVRERFPLVSTTTNLDEVLSNRWIDAVVIATPASAHFDIAAQCLRKGKHVLVEKPLTVKAEESEKLIQIAEQEKRLLMVGHTFLYNASVRKVKELMSARDFGKVYYLHATRTNMGPIRKDVNTLWDLASHDVAICNYLLESQPSWVSAIGARVLGNGLVDVGFVTLTYPNGVIANIHASWADPNKVREVVVVGSQRRIVFDDLNNLEHVKIYEKGVDKQNEADSFGEFKLLMRDGDIISPRVEPSEPLKTLANHFLDCVVNGERPLTDGKNGLDVVRVMMAIDESVEQNGCPVAVA